MADCSIINGIIIVGIGGAIAGITVYSIHQIHKWIMYEIDSRKILKWLIDHTEDKPGEKYRSTRSIASGNNLTMDRVKYVCSRDPNIYLYTGDTEDMWGVYKNGNTNLS